MAQKANIKKVKLPKGLDPVARKEFNRVKAELLDLNYLEIDQPSLLAYLTHFSLWAQAKEILEKEGLFIVTPKGFTQVHPAHSVMKQNAELVKKFIQELGFSPGSRKRLNLTLAVQADDDSDLYGEG